MPEMDGFAAIQKLKESDRTRHIPVMFLTASTDDAKEARGLELGAVDFVTKPFSAPVLLNRIAHHLHIEDLLKKRTERLENLKDSILDVVVDMVNSRDNITGGHITRMSAYMRILIEAMMENGVYADEMQGWDVETLISSARLHDVGKVAVADNILNKPGKLTPEEYEEIKNHAPAGEKIVDKIITKTGEESFLHHAKMFASAHHEKWNGTGYPRGLKGTDIPLQGRVMAIADVYDALVSERPYKTPYTHGKAEQIIRDDAGVHFDPAIVEVFLKVTEKFITATIKSQEELAQS
jgi:putative two-component system response regulator